MTEPADGGWAELEALWRDRRIPSPGGPPRRHALSWVEWVETSVPASLVLLAGVAVQEHRDAWGAAAAGLMILQAGGFAAIGWWGRRSVRQLGAESTLRFLTTWRTDCRRQLRAIWVVAVGLALEVMALVSWVVVGMTGAGRGAVVAEAWWLVCLGALLAAAAWLLLLRSRVLGELDRVAATRTELE